MLTSLLNLLKKTFGKKKKSAVIVDTTECQPKSIMYRDDYNICYLDPTGLKSANFCFNDAKYEIRSHSFRFGGKEIYGDSINFMAIAQRSMCLLTKSGGVFWKSLYDDKGERIKIPEKIKDISVGYKRVFLISTCGNAYAYGSNAHGALGTGEERIAYDNPVLIKISGKSFKKIITTKDFCVDFSLFLMGDFSIYACGSNNAGQLGVGKTKNIDLCVPRRVEFKRVKIIDVAMGFCHSLFLSNMGALFGCGLTSNGQLGFKRNKNVFVPIRIPFNRTIKHVFASGDHSFFVTQANTVHLLGKLEDNRSFNNELKNLAGKNISHIYMPQTRRQDNFFTNSNGEVFFSDKKKHLTTHKANFTVKPYSVPNSEHFNKVMDQQERLLFVMSRFAFFVDSQQKSQSNSNSISNKRQMLTIN